MSGGDETIIVAEPRTSLTINEAGAGGEPGPAGPPLGGDRENHQIPEWNGAIGGLVARDVDSVNARVWGVGRQSTPELDADVWVNEVMRDADDLGLPITVSGEFEVTADWFDATDLTKRLQVRGPGYDRARFYFRRGAGSGADREGAGRFIRMVTEPDALGGAGAGAFKGQLLASAVDEGELFIELVDTADLEPGDRIQILDEDGGIYADYYNGRRHASNSEWNTVFNVSGNTVQLNEPTNFAYSTATRVRRLNGMEYPILTGFSVIVPKDDAIAVGDARPIAMGVDLSGAFCPVIDIEFRNWARHMFQFDNCYGGFIRIVSRDAINTPNPLAAERVDDAEGNPISNPLGAMSHQNDTFGPYACACETANWYTDSYVWSDGGRHAWEGGGSESDVVNRHNTVRGKAMHHTAAPFDVHSLGTMDTHFIDIEVDGANLNDYPDANDSGASGIKSRGAGTLITRPKIRHCVVGITSNQGALDTRVVDPDVADCQRGVECWATNGFQMEGGRFRRISEYPLYFTPRVADKPWDKPGTDFSGVQIAEVQNVIIDRTRLEGDDFVAPAFFEWWDPNNRVNPKIPHSEKPMIGVLQKTVLPEDGSADDASNTLGVPRA